MQKTREGLHLRGIVRSRGGHFRRALLLRSPVDLQLGQQLRRGICGAGLLLKLRGDHLAVVSRGVGLRSGYRGLSRKFRGLGLLLQADLTLLLQRVLLLLLCLLLQQGCALLSLALALAGDFPLA